MKLIQFRHDDPIVDIDKIFAIERGAWDSNRQDHLAVLVTDNGIRYPLKAYVGEVMVILTHFDKTIAPTKAVYPGVTNEEEARAEYRRLSQADDLGGATEKRLLAAWPEAKT